ncbi:VanZ like family protein [Metalysinibacillus saudimassiliensis]|uniref:VanZ like family protein n=1 Tax=Metalysinibacillus saudimassiliensis TaxID=1461583 RepID=A0A078MEP1_9BACL|nr:VanZ like family protein [Metalysinibacillus saudimassiliensis]
MKKFYFIGILLVVLVIFSSMTAEQQSLQHFLQTTLSTKPFEAQLSQLAIPYWDTIVSVDERGYFAFVEFLIRKSAHFLMFATIAVALLQFRLHPIIVLIIAFGIALGDEFRQSFTPGRTMTMQDVWLDSAGAVFGIVLWLTYSNLMQQKATSR